MRNPRRQRKLSERDVDALIHGLAMFVSGFTVGMLLAGSFIK